MATRQVGDGMSRAATAVGANRPFFQVKHGRMQPEFRVVNRSNTRVYSAFGSQTRNDDNFHTGPQLALLLNVPARTSGEPVMFMHNKRLMYTVRVGSPDPRMANLILE